MIQATNINKSKLPKERRKNLKRNLEVRIVVLCKQFESLINVIHIY